MADAAHIRHLAHLARLDLSDAEVEAFALEAQRILATFDALPPAPPAEGAAPPESPGRPDERREPPSEVVEAILAQVPRRDRRLILVPRGGE